MASLSPTETRLRELERQLGKGATFAQADIKLILKSGVPAWLVYAARTPGTQKDRCQKAIDALVALRKDLTLPEAFGTVKDDA